MAIAMRTFGSTLSDLQALTNADKGLDYQRANAQDAINAQRLEAFLRLRGQALQTEAQKNRDAADRAQRMAELIQQGSQFKTSEENKIKLGQMEADSRRDAAKATAEGRLNPQLEGLKLQHAQEEAERRSLSEARKKISDEMRLLEQAKAKNFWDFGDPNDPGARWTSTRYGALRDAREALDKNAAQLGLSPHPDGGYVGYDVPSVVVPVTPPQAVAPVPPMIPIAPAPAATGSAYMGLGGMLPSTANRVVAPVPSMIQPRVSGGGTNYFDFSNGALVPR